MIDRIVIENFKSLRRVDLSLGRMNLFIGANASGKSNFLDALHVLQGIGERVHHQRNPGRQAEERK